MDKNIITTPLNGISQKIGNTSLKEVVFEIFCISIPKNMERNSIKELKKILKINPPKIGKSTLNNEGSMRLIKNNSLLQDLILSKKAKLQILKMIKDG